MGAQAGALVHAIDVSLGRRSVLVSGHAEHVLWKKKIASTVTTKERGKTGDWAVRLLLHYYIAYTHKGSSQLVPRGMRL